MDGYSLVFLIDHFSRPVIRAKLNTFLWGRTDSVRLWIEGSEPRPFAASDALPEQNFFYPLFWILSDGVPTTDAPSVLTDRKLYKPKSFSDINSFFDMLQETCTWALFPWGGISSYGALCFLACEDSTADEFMSAQPNEIRPYESQGEWVPKDGVTKSCSSIISSRRVLSGIEDVAKCAVFEDGYDTAGRCVWDVCVSDGRPPLVVSDHFEDENLWIMEARWNHADVDILDRFFVDGDDGIQDGTELAVYAPRDEASFLKMCHPGGSSLTCLFVFPASSDLKRIKYFVREIGKFHGYTDLCHMQAFLNAADWVYTSNRGHMDAQYSVFTSHESSLVARIVSHPTASLFALF